MLLLICPLVGYSFVQAVSLYSEASAAAVQSPVLAASLSPLDGILVPTFGSFYIAVTLLFPFVAIRVLGQEKETGALRLLVQLPYRSSTLILAKLGAVLAAWLMVSLPALSALAIWTMLGGHLAASETLNLLFGHLLYGVLVGALALSAATISESSATAAIIVLAATIGSWVLDFTLAGHPGLSAWVAQLSLTQTLRPFEQGLLSAGLVLGVVGVICGLTALASLWLRPGVLLRTRLMHSLICLRRGRRARLRDADQVVGRRYPGSSKLVSCRRAEITHDTETTARRQSKSHSRRPALSRSPAQRTGEA
jgi:ABC-type transport system involved in multi-copper enzyme maturation permease subunit